tara:strand:+ start:239 stop:1339 length:1101 start_codon:yes stop_codon:yes gene_type:complete
MRTKPEKNKNSPVRALTWQESAKSKGFELPEEFEGVKVVNFSYLDVQMLENNIQKLPAQCRVYGESEEHISELARSIDAVGLKEAAIATKDTLTGDLMPLTHHRLKAYSELKRKKIPCFEVEITPYGQMSHSRILLDYIGPLGLNKEKPPALPMSQADILAYLNELHHTFSQFGAYKQGSDVFEKGIKKYLKKIVPTWTEGNRTKVYNNFMDGVRPRKMEPLDSRKVASLLKDNSEDPGWDLDKNIITHIMKNESIFPNSGALQKLIYEESLSYSGNDFQKKMSQVKIRLITYEGSISGKSDKKVKENRNAFKNTITNLNVHKNAQHIFPWNVDEIVVMPQILQPPTQKETKPVSFKWDAAKQEFV